MIQSNIFMSAVPGQCHQIFTSFLLEFNARYFITKRIISLCQTIETLQKKMRNKMKTREAKCLALSGFWEKNLFTTMATATNKWLKKYTKVLLSISLRSRHHVIKMFLNRCQYLHINAFFQWRYIYHPNKPTRLRKYLLKEEFFIENEDFLLALHRNFEMVTVTLDSAMNFLEEKHL